MSGKLTVLPSKIEINLCSIIQRPGQSSVFEVFHASDILPLAFELHWQMSKEGDSPCNQSPKGTVNGVYKGGTHRFRGVAEALLALVNTEYDP